MKPSASILICTLALATWATADLPKKAPFSKYTGLVQNSPFTSKPPPPGPIALANPLDDYALSGISPIAGGYQVTLINKKNPEDRIPVRSNEKNKQGFKILEVNRKDGNPLGTTVKLSSSNGTGTVAFEDKYLTLAAAPAPKPQAHAPHPAGIPQAHPGTPNQPGQTPARLPRPRVVPPATPGAPPTPATGNQATPFQPGGQQPHSSGNRFDRRTGSGGRR